MARRDPDELVSRVYRSMERDFFPAPPLTLHSPSPELLAGAWGVFREVVLCGDAPRAWKEAIAVAVARANRCPYCVDVHTLALHGLGAHAAARHLATGSDGASAPGELGRIVAWAEAVRSPGAEVLRRPPFPVAWAPELVGTAVAFQYITAVVTVFLGSSPLPRGVRWLRRPVRRLGGALLGRKLRRRPVPGLALELLPESPLPPELAWAAADPRVAGAYARLAAAVEHAGCAVLSAPARERVARHLARWRGEAPPLGTAWIDEALEALEGGAGLKPAERARARLALLVALAPERVTGGDLEEVRSQGAGDRELVEVAAWAAFTAGLQVGRWMGRA